MRLRSLQGESIRSLKDLLEWDRVDGRWGDRDSGKLEPADQIVLCRQSAHLSGSVPRLPALIHEVIDSPSEKADASHQQPWRQKASSERIPDKSS
jgi:hypothetical protein